jgi:hypothetical protein
LEDDVLGGITFGELGADFLVQIVMPQPASRFWKALRTAISWSMLSWP